MNLFKRGWCNDRLHISGGHILEGEKDRDHDTNKLELMFDLISIPSVREFKLQFQDTEVVKSNLN